MPDFRQIMKSYPSVHTYLRDGLWVRRGEVVAYGPDQQRDHYSTDGSGFRHGVLEGREYGLEAAFSGSRFGLALGASQCFGFGLGGNQETLPSQLARRLGYPVVNVSFPEADLRTLFAAAVRISRAAPAAPAFILVFAGGSGSRFGYTRRCDPLFGSPDFLDAASHALPVDTDAAARNFDLLMQFCAFWSGELRHLAVSLAVPVTVAVEPTALEKATLSELELQNRLGTPREPGEADRFAVHRARYSQFRKGMADIAASNGVGFFSADADGLEFIDEMHLTAQSTEQLAQDLAPVLTQARSAG